jgi:S1-C subfamily serine protease
VEELEGEGLAALKLGAGQGAFRVKSVEEGKVLAGAGFQGGDVLLGFAGTPLPPGDAFRQFWVRANAVRPGQEVAAEVLRGGGRKTFTARWPE